MAAQTTHALASLTGAEHLLLSKGPYDRKREVEGAWSSEITNENNVKWIGQSTETQSMTALQHTS